MDNPFTTVREHHGWTKRELAEALGVSRQAVGFYEAGDRRPETDIAYRLIDLAARDGISVSLEDIYPRERESAA